MLLKLAPTTEQHQALLDTMHVFNEAANYVASIAFAEKTANKFELQKLVYGELRTTYKLAAQLAIRCYQQGQLKPTSATRAFNPPLSQKVP